MPFLVQGLLLQVALFSTVSSAVLGAAIGSIGVGLVGAWSVLQQAQADKGEWPAALVRVMCFSVLAVVTGLAGFSFSKAPLGGPGPSLEDVLPGLPGVSVGSGGGPLELLGQLSESPSVPGRLSSALGGKERVPGVADLAAIAQVKEKIPGLVNTANEAISQQDFGAAGDALMQALALSDSLGPVLIGQRSSLVRGIVTARIQQKRHGEAISLAREHVSRLQSHAPLDRKDLGRFCEAMGNYLGTAEQYRESAEFFAIAFEQLEVEGVGQEVLATLRAQRAMSLWRSGEQEAGRKELLKARSLAQGMDKGLAVWQTIGSVEEQVGFKE